MTDPSGLPPKAYEFKQPDPWIRRARRICRVALTKNRYPLPQRKPGEVLVVSNWWRCEGEVPRHWEDKGEFERSVRSMRTMGRLDVGFGGSPETAGLFDRVLRITESGKPGFHCIFCGRVGDAKTCVYVRVTIKPEADGHTIDPS